MVFPQIDLDARDISPPHPTDITHQLLKHSSSCLRRLRAHFSHVLINFSRDAFNTPTPPGITVFMLHEAVAKGQPKTYIENLMNGSFNRNAKE